VTVPSTVPNHKLITNLQGRKMSQASYVTAFSNRGVPAAATSSFRVIDDDEATSDARDALHMQPRQPSSDQDQCRVCWKHQHDGEDEDGPLVRPCQCTAPIHCRWVIRVGNHTHCQPSDESPANWHAPPTDLSPRSLIPSPISHAWHANKK
jgi:hypothetical protein